MSTENKISGKKRKEKRALGGKQRITVLLPAEIQNLIEKERKATGETITQIIERAVTNLFSSNQRQSPYDTHQRFYTNQLQKIANDLRVIVHKVDKIASKQASDKYEPLNVVVAGKKHRWQNHPQKEKIYQMVRDMHRVGANLSMIASGLNIEGFKKINGDENWKVEDVKEIVDDLKHEIDYIPPLYSLPD